MSKHAYLIIAHNEFEILSKLIQLIDDNRNDIYLHVDSKVKNFNFDFFRKLPQKSTITFVKRRDVRWGHYSLIKCEVELLKSAIQKRYDYYHLISGVDLLLKSQDEIHDFFNKHQGKEFIHFCSREKIQKVNSRIQYYHFVKYHRTALPKVNRISRLLDTFLLRMQQKLKYKRRENESLKLYYGCNWFSITDDLARYVVQSEGWIKKHFKYTLCGDELFLQTLVYNSKFKDTLYCKELNDDYEACMRYIDWNRGQPYVFRNEDFDELLESNQIFARKFSTVIDNKIINRLYQYLSDDKK